MLVFYIISVLIYIPAFHFICNLYDSETNKKIPITLGHVFIYCFMAFCPILNFAVLLASILAFYDDVRYIPSSGKISKIFTFIINFLSKQIN